MTPPQTQATPEPPSPPRSEVLRRSRPHRPRRSRSLHRFRCLLRRRRNRRRCRNATRRHLALPRRLHGQHGPRRPPRRHPRARRPQHQLRRPRQPAHRPHRHRLPQSLRVGRASLAAWLAAHKTYPEIARRRGEQGRAVVRFTVDRDGQVLDVQLVSGTGSTSLDDAVERMLHGAHLPAIPARDGRGASHGHGADPLSVGMKPAHTRSYQIRLTPTD